MSEQPVDGVLEHLVPRPGALTVGGDQLVAVTCRCGRDRGLVSACVAAVILAHGCAGCWGDRARELAATAKRRRFKVIGAPIQVHIPAPRRRRVPTAAIPDPPQDLPRSPSAGAVPANTTDPEGEGMDQRTEDRVEKLLVQHTSIADIIEQTGCGRVDVIALRDQLRSEDTVCQCGNELGHRGTCRGSSPAKTQPEAPEASPTASTSAANGSGPDSILRHLDERAGAIRAEIEQREQWLAQIAQARESIEAAATALAGDLPG